MALHLTPNEIQSRFDKESDCRVSYHNQKRIVKCKLKYINWKTVAALTVIFEKPYSYLIDGEECRRDGVRIVVEGD
jgi:hypothetical protein